MSDSNSNKEPCIFINPLIFAGGEEISCCKIGAKVHKKYMKLFSKLDGKTVKLVCKIKYYDPDAETDLEGITLEPVEA